MMQEPIKRESKMYQRVSEARRLHKIMWSKKDSWHNYWQTIAELFYPERATFTGILNPGAEQHDGLYSSSPQQLSFNLSSKIGAMVRPRGKDWFRVIAKPDEYMRDDGVRYWCEHATRTLRNVIYDRHARFTSAMAESDRDYVTFGNSPVYHALNSRGDGMIFRCIHLANCAWARDLEGMLTDFHERYTMFLTEAARIFGQKNLPKEWQKRLEAKNGDKMEKVTIVRAVKDRMAYEYGPGEVPLEDQRFSALYFALDEECDAQDAALGEGFYPYMPYTVRTWMDVSGEDYARSPVTAVALCDARTLNTVEAALIEGIEKKISPPLWALHDAVVGEFSLRARDVSFVDPESLANSKSPFGVIESGDPRYAMEYLGHKEAIISRAHFAEILRRLPDKEMTAYEASNWIEAYTEEAAPIFEPMEADNASIVDATFQQSMISGAFQTPPEVLRSARVDYEFETPLTQARRKMLAQQYQAMVGTVAAAKQVYPDAGNQINWIEAERDGLSGEVPQTWLLPRDVAEARQAQIDQALVQQEQEAQAMQMAEMAARANPQNLRQIEEAL